MSKYAVVLALPDYIQSDLPELSCYVAYVWADNLSQAHTFAKRQAVGEYEGTYEADEYECKPDDFAHLVTFEGHPPTLQFGSFLCQCACGTKRVVLLQSLPDGTSKS